MTHRHTVLSILSLACLASAAEGSTQLIGGDSIGPDSSATDFNGGFPAVEGGTNTIGQPAVEISQNGSSLLDSMRVIVHGEESSATENLHFNFFNYNLKVWGKADYLAGLAPEIVADLGEPIGITLIQPDASRIVPSEVFGEASYDPGSFSRPSYDFRFDLTAATFDGSTTLAFDEPLSAGDYIVAFVSEHNAASGGLYVSLSTIGQGLTPYFYQHIDNVNLHPRGILLGQPAPYEYRWGWNIFQSPVLPGDFDFDGNADGGDFLKWQAAFGSGDSLSDGDDDGLVDGDDLDIWRDHFGEVDLLAESSVSVPEPRSFFLLLFAISGLRPPRNGET